MNFMKVVLITVIRCIKLSTATTMYYNVTTQITRSKSSSTKQFYGISLNLERGNGDMKKDL